MTVDGTCNSTSEIVGCAVEISSEYGCTSCLPGFFAKDRTCSQCNATYERCAVCTEDACGECSAEHVMSGGACLHFTNITHCTAAGNSKCTKCSFWHAPTASGDRCETHAVWWFILIVVLVALLMFAALIAVVVVCVWTCIRHAQQNKQHERTCVFKMARSNVTFTPTRHRSICVDKYVVAFEGAIPVDVESKELLCVGNKGKKDAKIQFVAKEGNEKFAVRSNPTTVTLARGMACEFEVLLTPLCSCTIDDKVMVVAKEKGVKDAVTASVGVKAETELTTKLHYDDIICDKQIGEGSFGIVFKGTFHGNDVAVKKMKEVGVSADSMDEFEKEVAMLDKFRCEQIVHFYGACFIRNHVMMVTEFAPCGSLADCIKKRDEPSEAIKAKLMLDAAKGLNYLHSNGVLHRDIKPDNVLVFSIDEVISVNGKLTDLGSTRKINLRITNMTFTKGIRTPKFMRRKC